MIFYNKLNVLYCYKRWEPTEKSKERTEKREEVKQEEKGEEREKEKWKVEMINNTFSVKNTLYLLTIRRNSPRSNWHSLKEYSVKQAFEQRVFCQKGSGKRVRSKEFDQLVILANGIRWKGFGEKGSVKREFDLSGEHPLFIFNFRTIGPIIALFSSLQGGGYGRTMQ